MLETQTPSEPMKQGSKKMIETSKYHIYDCLQGCSYQSVTLTNESILSDKYYWSLEGSSGFEHYLKYLLDMKFKLFLVIVQ